MDVNYYRDIISTRITNFTLFLSIIFLKRLSSLKCLLNLKIFLYIDIRKFANKITFLCLFFINIFVYYIIYIYVIISSMIPSLFSLLL